MLFQFLTSKKPQILVVCVDKYRIMKPSLNDRFIAYLTLISGLSISAIAIYYSVMGLMAIFAAAVVPIIVMGIALEIGKLVATVWLKQNWKIAPFGIRIYLGIAILVLMLITSMGIFGFLSKAHSDQSLVSGDVLAKIAVYDEKIAVEKDTITTNRKALKQLDESVDQVMLRSTDEKGADKAVALRRSQSKERTRLLNEISTAQKNISSLNEERAPIAAEVRKVDAEVGPIKYIAAFFYGATDQTVLEKSVTWVIITLIVVFDPLAVVLLLSSQYSFQNFQKTSEETFVKEIPIEEDPEPILEEEILDEEEITLTLEESPKEEISLSLVEEPKIEDKIEEPKIEEDIISEPTKEGFIDNDKPYFWTSYTVKKYSSPETPKEESVAENNVDAIIVENKLPTYIQNEEQQESGKWQQIIEAKEISEEEYINKVSENQKKT